MFGGRFSSGARFDSVKIDILGMGEECGGTFWSLVLTKSWFMWGLNIATWAADRSNMSPTEMQILPTERWPLEGLICIIYIHTEREKICYVYMLYAICSSLIIYTQHEKNVLFSLSCLLTLGYSRSGPFPSRQGSCSAGQPVWARRLCARRSRRPSLELRTADGNGTFFKQNYGKPQNLIPKSSGTSNGGCAPATMVTHFLGGQYLWDHVHDWTWCKQPFWYENQGAQFTPMQPISPEINTSNMLILLFLFLDFLDLIPDPWWLFLDATPPGHDDQIRYERVHGEAHGSSTDRGCWNIWNRQTIKCQKEHGFIMFDPKLIAGVSKMCGPPAEHIIDGFKYKSTMGWLTDIVDFPGDVPAPF